MAGLECHFSRSFTMYVDTTKQRLNPRNQFSRTERFAYMIICSYGKGVYFILLLDLGCQENNTEPFVRFHEFVCTLQTRQCLEP